MTNVTLRAGGAFTQAAAIVSADQTTILGNGTFDDPIRLAGDSTPAGSFLAGYLPELSIAAIPGLPVYVSAADLGLGVTTVSPAIGVWGGGPQAHVVGIISEVHEDDGTVLVQTTGPLTLTEGEWGALTGGAGIVQGTTYYLVALFTSGPVFGLAAVVPHVVGMPISQVGVAVSATTMQISPSLGTVLFGGDSVFFTTMTSPVAGKAVRQTGGSPAVVGGLDTSIAAAQVVGLVGAVGAATAVALQSTDVLTLDTAHWDAVVTGQVGGLSPGTAYYVDHTTNGNLSAAKPTASGRFIAQVGIAISSTQMRLCCPVTPQAIP